jgi:DNA polymerase-3 subunit delta'
MIIWLPEKMNQQTANKLLKTLEEPAEKTVLILVAENTDFMLSTILSRVQQIKIPTIDKADIKSYLSQKYSLSDDLLNFAINYGKGSLPQTINSIETSENQHQYFLWFTQLMRFNYANKMLDTINLTDEILSQDKSQLQNFLKYAIRYIRDNFMLNQEQDKMVFLIEEEQEFANKFSKFITSNNIEKIYNTFNNTLININKNANVKIQMQILSIELVRAFSMI